MNNLTRYEKEMALFAKVVGILENAARGLDLPSPIGLTYIEPINIFNKSEDELLEKPKIKEIAVRPESYIPVYAAIYEKMITMENYQPYLKIKSELEQAESQLDSIAAIIHYPENWKTDEYPTIEDAIKYLWKCYWENLVK